MREYTLPVALLLLVAVCCGSIYYFYATRPAFTTKTGSVKLSLDEINALDAAERLLEKGNASEAWHLLKSMRSDPLRTRLLKTESMLRLGKSPTYALSELEKEVAKDRGLDLVFALARVHEANRDWRKARGLYEDLLKAALRQELRTRVQQRFFSLCLLQNKVEEAVQTLRSGNGRLSVTDEDITILLEAIVNEKNEALLDELPRLVATATNRSVRFQFALADAWNSLKQREKAKKHLQEALKLQNDHVPSLYVLFEFARQNDSFNEAREYLQRLVSTGKTLPERKDWDVIFLRSSVQAHQSGNIPQAFLFLKHAIFLNKANLGADIQSILQACDLYYRNNGTPEEKAFFSVFKAYVNGEYDVTISKAEKLSKTLAEATMKEHLAIMVQESRLFIEREQAARVQLTKNANTSMSSVARAAGTVKVSQATSTIDPNLPPPDPDESPSITAIKAKYKERSDDPAALLADAKELMAASAWNGAAFYLEAVLKADPHHEESLRLLARVQEKRGRHEEAVAILDELLQRNPSDALLRATLACNLNKTRDSARGLKEARLALDLDPNLLEAYVALGEFFEMRQRPTEALEHVNKGLMKITDSNAEAAQALYDLKDRLEKNNSAH